MNITKTCRGFDLIEFKDKNNINCSLQKSSIAGEDCIWLGLNNPDLKEFYPYPRNIEDSFIQITKDDLDKLKHRPQNEIYINSRMHLTQTQAKELLPYIQRFIETGELL